MDWPLRTKLLVAFVGVVVLGGVLTMLAGGFSIHRMVIGEAQRRVDLALKTAHAMLDLRLEEDQKVCLAMSERVICEKVPSLREVDPHLLRKLREKGGYTFLHLVDRSGVIVATARGRARGTPGPETPVITHVLNHQTPAAGVSLLPLSALALEDEKLAAEARIKVLPTPRAKPVGPSVLTAAMVLEAAAPLKDGQGRLVGAIHVGTVLNNNFELVDFVRQNVFTFQTYEPGKFLRFLPRKPKNLGTVTIFQGDVRIATNVVGPDGRRAVGTRVSAEVYDRVLGKGLPWTGPAFVVDSWYLSAYEPLRDLNQEIIGMLYVGVLKDRYDDMRNGAMGLFIVGAILSLVGAVSLSSWVAGRLAGPLMQLTDGADEVARGNLDYQLPRPPRADRDEIKRLTLAFDQMVVALRERDEQLRRSHDELQRAADELHQWVQNYLDTLEFITHELKNQIAAMKINLLAVRDGYVGEIDAEQKEALEDVVQAVNRAEEMILNYLNLSRIEKGELLVRARPTHVEIDVVRPVLRDLRGRLEARKMQVEVRLQEGLTVQADPSLLQIVYENLLNNAAKYGREGGTLRVSGQRLNGRAELRVWNDGPGVPLDHLDELFQKFSRLHPPGEQARGTGLGLFITREIVRRHGGDIQAQSVPGQWIEFVFTLPVPDALLGDDGGTIGG